MKKMTILAIVLALALALTGCGSEKAPETTAATSPAAVTVPTGTATVTQPLTLTGWNLSASTWSSPNGATVHITASPNVYEEGQQATFVVRLESDDIVAAPCQWDGTSYTASADLNAANGYCYYVVLTAADGTSSEVAVNTPAAPTNEALINLEASLESYCSVTVEEAAFEGRKLTLTSGKLQVQAPTITNEGEVLSCQEAQLVLRFNGEELDKKTLTLTQTETTGLWEVSLENTVFEIPELENEQQVELTADVTLTNGHTLSAYGCYLVYNEDGLLPFVG